MMKARARRYGWASLVAALLLAVAFLIRTEKTQWDLKVYMACSRTLASGGNPYATQPFFDGSNFQCLYPPLIIDLYRPFTAASDAFGEGAGERFWALMKVLSMIWIIYLWRKIVLRPGPDLWRALFAALAFGSPFMSDFRAGNAGSFEHALLWAALAAFIAGKDLLFAALLAASAQPKLAPLAFLPLVISKPRPNVRALFLGGTLAVGAFALNEWAHPGLLREFFLQLADPKQPWRYERGPNNCSFVGLTQHVLETAWGNRPLASSWAMRVNAVWSAAIVGATGWSLARLWNGAGAEEDKRRRAVLLYAVAYALIVPRLKDYSFLLLIPSAIAALESDAPVGARAAILALALLNSTKALAEKAGMGHWSLFASYFKLYAIMLVWAVLVFPRHYPLENKSVKR
jgi:hypothetical protein